MKLYDEFTHEYYCSWDCANVSGASKDNLVELSKGNDEERCYNCDEMMMIERP